MTLFQIDTAEIKNKTKPSQPPIPSLTLLSLSLLLFPLPLLLSLSSSPSSPSLPFSSTTAVAALAGEFVNAETVIFGTDVDGVYSADPRFLFFYFIFILFFFIIIFFFYFIFFFFFAHTNFLHFCRKDPNAKKHDVISYKDLRTLCTGEDNILPGFSFFIFYFLFFILFFWFCFVLFCFCFFLHSLE